jgi:hypothetical protein
MQLKALQRAATVTPWAKIWPTIGAARRSPNGSMLRVIFGLIFRVDFLA